MIASLVGWFIGALASLAGAGALGGAAGIASALAARMFGGLKGYAVAAAVGAALLAGAYGAGWLGGRLDASAAAELARLKAEKEKLAHELSALEDVRGYEQAQARARAERMAESERRYAEVLAAIEKHKDDPGCAVDEEVMRAIGAMR